MTEGNTDHVGIEEDNISQSQHRQGPFLFV